MILDEDPPVLVGHGVHRQARLAVRPGEEGHRGGAGVGAQEGPLALAVWGRSNTFVLRFCDEKLYDEKSHVARQPDPPETVCTIPVMTLAAMMTLGLVAPAILRQEIVQTKSN